MARRKEATVTFHFLLPITTRSIWMRTCRKTAFVVCKLVGRSLSGVLRCCCYEQRRAARACVCVRVCSRVFACVASVLVGRHARCRLLQCSTHTLSHAHTPWSMPLRSATVRATRHYDDAVDAPGAPTKTNVSATATTAHACSWTQWRLTHTKTHNATEKNAENTWSTGKARSTARAMVIASVAAASHVDDPHHHYHETTTPPPLRLAHPRHSPRMDGRPMNNMLHHPAAQHG